MWEAKKTFKAYANGKSEPDLIILKIKIICFIVAKISAPNETK
jgi:hypothetical protein